MYCKTSLHTILFSFFWEIENIENLRIALVSLCHFKNNCFFFCSLQFAPGNVDVKLVCIETGGITYRLTVALNYIAMRQKGEINKNAMRPQPNGREPFL